MKKFYVLTLVVLLSVSVFGQSPASCFVQIMFNSSGNLCFGNCNGTATAFPVGTGPYTYSWSNGATTQNLSALCAGNYTVTVTDLGAGSATCTGNGTITCPALLNVSISPSGNSATAIASGGTFPYTYLWSPSGQTSMTATGLSTGTYTCTVTDANGCTRTSTVTITLTSLSEDNVQAPVVRIYPNPVSDLIHIEWQSIPTTTISFLITNVFGELILSETVSADKILNHSINLSSYANGVYYIAIDGAGTHTTQKILKISF